MKKFISVIIAILIIVLCVSGCTNGGYSTIKSVEKGTSKYWQMSYEKFNGNKKYTLKSSEDGEHTFNIEIITNSGTLGLTIKDEDGTSIYNGNELPSSSFEVKANGKGKYTIEAKANNHNGSFNIKLD